MLTPDQLAALRKPIRFSSDLRGQALTFESTWGLFSPREVDEGTRLLLQYVEVPADADCLDLGCGYGPVGLTLASLARNGRTLMVDKDFVAVDFATRNAARNGLSNASVCLSNGFDQVPADARFDLIASNVPAKVGKELLSILLHDAHARLRPGGAIYLVAISGLRDFFKRNLKEVFGNYDKVKQGAHYTVARARR